MSPVDALAQERRARLAAERMLELKQKELFAANKQLSQHALALTHEIVEQREEVEVVRHAAEELRGRNTQVLQDLEQAQEAADAAQRRLWDSVATIEDGFAVFDKSGALVSANPAYMSVFEEMECMGPGVTYTEVINILVEEGIVDIGTQSAREWRDFMLARWNSPELEPTTIKLWNRQFIRLVDRRSQNGDTVSLALNITEAIRREEELEDALLKAEAANLAKSAFLAKMSHELRTPMNGVVGMADLLAETTLDEDQQLFVDTIRISGESLLSLINDVLDFSKMEAAKLVLHKEEFGLERTLNEVLMLFHPAVVAKSVDLILDYDMFLPTLFMGDPGRIRQILTNLIGNAVKFTSTGHVLVRAIGLPDGDGDDYRVHITVEDTGPGIPTAKIDHIFGEFNQVEDQKNRQFEGTGLGLAIAKQLVTLMGGEIWVDSVVDQGSSFGFFVPLPSSDRATFSLDKAPDWVSRIVMLSRPSQSALILTKQLRILGIEVVEATPAQFAERPVTQSGDVLVVDAERSRRTGSMAINAMLRSGVKVPVVLMQNLQDDDSDFTYENVTIINKPAGRKLLIDAMSNISPSEAMESDAKSPAHAPPEAENPRPAAVADDTVASSQLRPMRILAAEDNKTNRLVLSKLIAKLNLQLEFAENGVEAVQKWQDFRPDLVFMDISMPIMDGKEATRRIRQIEAEHAEPATPIVALTAHALSGDETEFLAAGLTHCLTKPLRKEAIFEQIRKARPAHTNPVFASPEPLADTEDLLLDAQAT